MVVKPDFFLRGGIINAMLSWDSFEYFAYAFIIICVGAGVVLLVFGLIAWRHFEKRAGSSILEVVRRAPGRAMFLSGYLGVGLYFSYIKDISGGTIWTDALTVMYLVFLWPVPLLTQVLL